MKYPQSFIEEIRARIRVSEIVGRAVPLRRAGREFHALCPFHKEKSPSFTVNDEKGFFHCFGCGAHGDVIGFTMDYEHLGYREAVERLAGVAGLSVPRETKLEVEREEKAKSLQQVMEFAASWFEEQMENTAEGELARRYLAERGLTGETRAKFRIGYAPADRDALTRMMKTKGVTEAQMIEVGLLIKVEDRAPYSRFRRRLMFPIRDRKSRVIAFGGRVLPGEPNDDAPKYLNSPETPLFHKGRQLFNLDLARRAAFDARQLIVAEGYMDVIALAQAGIAHAVAPLGTAITPEQLQMCWQLVDEPTLCLDGDNAGQRAMSRAMDVAMPLLVPGKTLRIAVLPKGDDPDSLVRGAGKAAFEQIIAAAMPLATLLWQQVMETGAATPEARAAQEQLLMQKVAGIKHPTVQHYYKQYMRDRLHAMGQVRYEKGSFKGKRDFKNNAPTSTVVPPPLARSSDGSLLVPATNLLALVMAHPALLMDAGAEEFWLHAPMPAPWQQELHNRITEMHIDSPEPRQAAELMQLMTEEAPKESLAPVARAMEALGVELAKDEMIRTGRAERLWGEVVNDVERARLRSECVEAEAALAAELTEENLTRLTTLKSQLEAIDRERSRFYQQDPLSGAV
jgi:DNA primase